MKRFFQHIGSAEIRNVIAVICVIGVFGLLFLLAFKAIPKENNELMYMAVGQVLALGFGVVVGYFFGSSKNETDAKKQSDNQQ
jgi:ABC-type nitrate/sulfonate/bicarbonate transport system permease component